MAVASFHRGVDDLGRRSGCILVDRNWAHTGRLPLPERTHDHKRPEDGLHCTLHSYGPTYYEVSLPIYSQHTRHHIRFFVPTMNLKRYRIFTAHNLSMVLVTLLGLWFFFFFFFFFILFSFFQILLNECRMCVGPRIGIDVMFCVLCRRMPLTASQSSH